MPDLLTLRGRNALSEFRLKKLTHTLKLSAPGIAAITAEYWHFVSLRAPLSAAERKILERILTYGPASRPAVGKGDMLLVVVPRLGTISPWSSKATDIARPCGLDAVERIERGVAYHAVLRRARAAYRDGRRRSLLPLIHDRMTETVLDSLDERRRLVPQRSAPAACPRRPAGRRPRGTGEGQPRDGARAVRRRDRLPASRISRAWGAIRPTSS